MHQRPRMLTLLAILTLAVGGLGIGRAVTQLAPFADTHERFVRHLRSSFEQAHLAGLSAEERQRIGEEYGEHEWQRRGAIIPLALANLVLSVLLLAGALETLRGNPWGPSTWEWAAQLSIPYTVVAGLLLRAELLDLRASLEPSLRAALPAGAGITATDGVHDLAATDLVAQLVYPGLALLYGMVAIMFYLACVHYLRRPAVRSLFPSEAPRK